MKNMKLRIVIVALMIAIMGISVANATIAYFTDTDTKTNTFTVGKVDITLTNAMTELTTVYPTDVRTVNPTIKNVATDDAYVAAIITLKGTDAHPITALLGETTADGKVAVSSFLTGGALGADGFTSKTVVANNEIKIYVIATNKLAANGEIAVFGNVNIPAKWDTAQMEYLPDLTITVDAYATQTAGFTSAVQAIEAAFGMDPDTTNASYDVFAPYFAAP